MTFSRRITSKQLGDRALLADRHHGLSECIRRLLETSFNSVYLAADETSLQRVTQLMQPAVVVVDLSIAAGDVPGLIRELRARAPKAKVLLLSVHDEPSVLRSAAAGADGIILKRRIGTDLLPALEAILAGRRFIPPLDRASPLNEKG